MTPHAQAELPLHAQEFPDLAADGAAWLIAFLVAHPKGPGRHGAWPGREICQQISVPWNEATRRKFRSFREAAGPVIVSGPAGYQHVDHCPVEARRAAARIRLAQGRKMAQEATRELRAIAALEAISGTA